MECLRNGDQVNRFRVDARGRGRRNPKFYLSVRVGRADLLIAGVRCHDLLEKRRKGSCGLAIAGGAVPREFMLVTKCCQEVEQRLGIAGPMRGIAAGVAGKMILEADVGAMELLTCTVRFASSSFCIVVQRKRIRILVEQRLDARIARRMR